MCQIIIFFTLPNTTVPINLITFLFLTMLQIMYESMKVRVENVLKCGKVSEEYITKSTHSSGIILLYFSFSNTKMMLQ